MKSSKIKKKLLVSILCASMMFQNMSIGAFASENVAITEAQTEEAGIEEAPGETYPMILSNIRPSIWDL